MINGFFPGEIWPDNNGIHINAHGGGILCHAGRYWWFGEHKIEGISGNRAHVGIHVYSSTDLTNWVDEGIALAVMPEGSGHPIARGCIIERPKVVYNEHTQEFVMYFHLETGDGYSAALTGLAIADKVNGPYCFIHSFRPNVGYWPQNVRPEQQTKESIDIATVWPEKIQNCRNDITPTLNILGRDFATGQQARDMTLFRDDDGKVYHLYSSEHNSTLHIAELSNNYLGYTGRYWRVFEHRWMEAPVIFKSRNRYFIIASDCTGWAPNAARLAVADHIGGPWTELGNPVRGTQDQKDNTFGCQGTFALTLDDGQIIFMADRWNPENAIDGRYVWLPVKFDNGIPYLEWQDKWTL